MKMFCTICDSELKEQIIEDMIVPQPTCEKCGKIEYGYSNEERQLVSSLRGVIGLKLWTISSILRVVREEIK